MFQITKIRMSEIIEQLRELETAHLSDAQCKVNGGNNTGCFSGTAIRNMAPKAGTVCGYAVTCTAVTAGLTKGPRITPQLYEKIESRAKPVVVAVQSMDQNPEYGTVFGGRMTAISRQLGACGIVTNAGVRDLDNIVSEGFGCYASGVCPSSNTFTMKEVDVPIEICGAKIKPGDIVHGDRDGFIVLKNGPGLWDILNLAREIRKEEQTYIAFLNSPEFSVPELMRRFYS